MNVVDVEVGLIILLEFNSLHIHLLAALLLKFSHKLSEAFFVVSTGNRGGWGQVLCLTLFCLFRSLNMNFFLLVGLGVGLAN